MQIMYQLGCFRFGKYASSQATYSSAVMFPSVHSSRIVRALYPFRVLRERQMQYFMIRRKKLRWKKDRAELRIKHNLT